MKRKCKKIVNSAKLINLIKCLRRKYKVFTNKIYTILITKIKNNIKIFIKIDRKCLKDQVSLRTTNKK
jgi:hypothetical protein